MNSFSSLVLAVFLLEVGTVAQAQNAPPQPIVKSFTPPNPLLPSQELLKSERDLVRVDDLWDTPLDWQETDSSTATIVAHIRNSLGDKAPLIEVRGTDTNRSTFALEKSPLGPTLCSLAALANLRVWAFPGRLVLATEEALSPDERESIKNRLGGEWKGRRMQWNAQKQVERTSVELVGAEVKERLAAQGIAPISPPEGTQFPPNPSVPLPYELPWKELSPATQDIVRDLLASRFAALRSAPLALDDSVTVGFDDTNKQPLHLRLQKPNADTADKRESIGDWYVSVPRPDATQ